MKSNDWRHKNVARYTPGNTKILYFFNCLLDGMHTILPDATIYVYDNNSTDGTDEIARRNGAIVRYEYQQGKGNVIRRMFRDIDAECYIMTDGDDTYPAVNAPEMVDKVLNRNVDMVVGDRLSCLLYTSRCV